MVYFPKRIGCAPFSTSITASRLCISAAFGRMYSPFASGPRILSERLILKIVSFSPLKSMSSLSIPAIPHIVITSGLSYAKTQNMQKIHCDFCKKVLTNPFCYAILLRRYGYAGVAQLVEQLICNQQVRGSSPFTSSINMEEFPSGQREQTVNLPSTTSVVRIHPLPPRKTAKYGGFSVFYRYKRTAEKLLPRLQKTNKSPKIIPLMSPKFSALKRGIFSSKTPLTTY